MIFIKNVISAFLPGTVLCAVCLLLPGCARTGLAPENAGQPLTPPSRNVYPGYASYKDIPGVTQEEIDAIEGFRGRTFVYGTYLVSECFDDNGSIGGFAALYSQWLSGLFDLDFTPAAYEWADLLDGLETGDIDFTGELTATSERLETYIMTGTIAQRPLIIARLVGHPDPASISVLRRPRFGFLKNAVSHLMLRPTLSYEIDAVFVDSSKEAYKLLREAEIDAFIEEGYEGAGAARQDLIIEEILPPVYNPVSMATRKAELAPIISVVQKYLNQGALYHLVNLYNQGRKDYFTYCFHASLTEEELAYVEAHNGSRGQVQPISFIMEKDNYPWAFYDTNEKAWQGIAWDVLKEIKLVTGLEFEVVSTKDDTWSENLAQLESGGGAIVSKLLRSSDRKDRFLWTDVPYARDNFALLSKRETPDVGINEILYSKVGLLRDSAYSEYFPLWFPNHPYSMEFPSRTEALAALEKGEIDLYMGTRNTLLNLTNYMEEPSYKVNLIFYQTADAFFGFNRNEKILCSIINKAQVMVNTELLESRWLTRTFDYRTKLMRTRQPYLIGFSVVLGVMVSVLVFLLKKYSDSRRHLQVMVKRRTQQLEVQRNAARVAYKVKNRFLANMSHEIRTPLNVIIGFSQAELEKANSTESRENLSSINHSGFLLLGIVNDLLDISSIESGDMQLNSGDYSLPVIISSAASSAKLRIGGKKIEFHLEVDEALPFKLHGDGRRVKQIVGNLLSNAVKFTNEGSIFFRISYEPREEENKLMLIFEVCDTGIGIRSEDIANLFSDFGQVDTESNRSVEGIGMGLLITKKLAGLMGGDVNVVSEYGKGSVFTAWVLQEIADKAVLGRDTAEKLSAFAWKEETQEKKFYLPYARVLVVDDVPTNHAVARGIMRPYKMTIDAVSSGQEAIDLIAGAEVHYDAIFMDHMMPGMDGMETTQRIRELDSDYARTIPIIALTANALPENEKVFLANGFNAFMTKPVNINALNLVLNQWVRDESKEDFFVGEQPEGSDLVQSGALTNCNIEGVDLAAGTAQFGGAENYLEIVKVFVSDTPKLLETVQNCLDGFRLMPLAAKTALDALKNYTITVHGIKGSCYGICATPVGDLARELEMAAKSHDFGKVMELNNQFIQATQRLVEELKSLLPQKEERLRDQKDAPDPMLLQKLLRSAQAYNINEIFVVLAELENYKYSENDNLIRQLREAADNYEYLDIIKLLSPVQTAINGDKTLMGAAG